MARIQLDKELKTLSVIVGGEENMELLKGDIRMLYLANDGLKEVGGVEFVDPNVTHKVVAVMARTPGRYNIDDAYAKSLKPWSSYQPVVEELANITRGNNREEAASRALDFFTDRGLANPDVHVDRFRCLCDLAESKGGFGIPAINTDGALIGSPRLNNALKEYASRYVQTRPTSKTDPASHQSL